MSCYVIMLPAKLLFKISLMVCPSILTSVYMAVMGFVSKAALLKKGISVGPSISKRKMAANNSSFVTVTEASSDVTLFTTIVATTHLLLSWLIG
ncbi:hypothetical protein G9A89_011789 [Geosiphon pyriformis]|nr:hypothetical protein G9A89_011789 [Geosiphon pyriformis]